MDMGTHDCTRSPTSPFLHLSNQDTAAMSYFICQNGSQPAYNPAKAAQASQCHRDMAWGTATGALQGAGMAAGACKVMGAPLICAPPMAVGTFLGAHQGMTVRSMTFSIVTDE